MDEKTQAYPRPISIKDGQAIYRRLQGIAKDMREHHYGVSISKSDYAHIHAMQLAVESTLNDVFIAGHEGPQDDRAETQIHLEEMLAEQIFKSFQELSEEEGISGTDIEGTANWLSRWILQKVIHGLTVADFAYLQAHVRDPQGQ